MSNLEDTQDRIVLISLNLKRRKTNIVKREENTMTELFNKEVRKISTPIRKYFRIWQLPMLIFSMILMFLLLWFACACFILGVLNYTNTAYTALMNVILVIVPVLAGIFGIFKAIDHWLNYIVINYRHCVLKKKIKYLL